MIQKEILRECSLKLNLKTLNCGNLSESKANRHEWKKRERNFFKM
jgi:hypothetical protein